MAAEAQLRAAHEQIGVAIAALLPQFSLTPAIVYSAAGGAGLLSAADAAWTILGGFTAPVFSGGSLQARVRAAQAAAQAARAQYQLTVLTAFQNVADSLYALKNDQTTWTELAEVERASKAALDHLQQQRRSGYASEPMELAARITWLQALQAAQAARSSLLADSVALHLALGGGWKDEGGE
jgi:outer membrane protein TolC